jgi:hypothetical protein
MKLTRRILAGTLATVALSRRSAAAEPTLPMPKGKVILTISGKISVFNAGMTAQFDRDMLEALGWSSFTTMTPWYDAPVTFAGVQMSKLMRVVGAKGDLVVATALNDYETRIPISDFTEFNVLLALQRNGEYMPVRDKGPLFIVYPYDSAPELKSQKYYARSAWQLARIVVM